MAGFATTALVGIVIIAVVSKVFEWRKAYTAAKATKFPTFLSPIHVRDIWWMVILPLVLPLLRRLPKKWTHPWLSMTQIFDIWKTGHKPFEDVGSDTFILSTPRGNILWTCDPKVCRQLEAAHPNFQKAVEMLKFLDIYGPTVASVEGDEWKVHRKIIMSAFTPATNARVWRETIKETGFMVDQWSKNGGVVLVVRHWTVRLALHVLATVFYGKRLTWNDGADDSDNLPTGYSVSFERSLFTVLGRLGVLLMIPRCLLGWIPLRYVRETHVAFVNFTQYVEEMIADAKAHPRVASSKMDQSMLEAVVAASSSTDIDENLPLSKASVKGNLFFVFSAGHETAGNTMSFAIYLLALYPEYQTKIQDDLDQQRVGNRREDWSVEHENQILQNGWLGAVLKEVLRLYCVVQWLPRVATAPIDVVDSKMIHRTIPKDTMVLLNFSAAFLNPSTWPKRLMPTERRAELHNSPAVDFDPSRWLAKGKDGNKIINEEGLLHFPFGQGPHVCPGRMFAMTEMTAMLATILFDHSLELTVDDETLQGCSGDYELAWVKTRDRAFRRLVDDITTNQNIELLKELPIRLKKRSKSSS